MWLRNVILKLDQSALPPSPKLVAAAVLICCVHQVKMFKFFISNNVSVALLGMLALPPDGEGVNFLRSFMKDNESL